MPYLAKTTAKGHDYYKIMESYRVDGKIKHRVVQNIGTLSQLFALLQSNGKEPEKTHARIERDNINIEIKPIRCRIHGDSFFLYKIPPCIVLLKKV